MDFDAKLTLAIRQRISDALSRSEFAVVIEGLDKHGSLEWVAIREEPDMRRTVTFFATPLDPPGQSQRWQFDLWAGAETDTRYTRQDIGRRTGSDLYRLVDWLAQWAVNAGSSAERLTVSDLDAAYPAPAVNLSQEPLEGDH